VPPAVCRHRDNAEEILEGLVNGRLHAGLLRVPVYQPEGVEMMTLLTEPAMLALPWGHPLVPDGRPRALAPAELRGEGFILVRRPGAPGLYANWLRLCEQAGFQPRVVAEVDRMMTNLNLVAAGAGVSVVPASMSGAHPDAIVYCPIAGGQALSAPLTLAWRSQDAGGPLARLIALSRELAQP
jgi:DNA-binding transcriptional LysR family regulator